MTTGADVEETRIRVREDRYFQEEYIDCPFLERGSTAMTSQQSSGQSREPEGLANAPSAKPPLASRIAASGALVFGALTLVVLVVVTAENLLYVAGSVLVNALAISTLWLAATNRRFRRWTVTAALLLVGASIAILVAQGQGVVAVVVVLVGVAAAWALGTLALRWEVRQALHSRWTAVAPAHRGVVFMNPRSGDGKVVRLGLADEARKRGVEAVLIKGGDDLAQLAEAAVTRGADALGVAGGDGSQAVVAAVAAAHGLPFVCVPAGTRNHFALDLGITRGDPVAALDAFGKALESRIDLGDVNGEIFVNNVSLGLYAKIVESDEYREAKRQTVAEMLPDLLEPGARAFELSTESPFGPVTDPQVILVSNNPYRLSSLGGFASRPALDTGKLGVATLSIKRPTDVNLLVALELAGHPERFEGWRQWSTATLEVRGSPTLSAAVDGEARFFVSPVRFTIRVGALRVRIAPSQVGASPAFLWAPLESSTLVGLWRIIRGRPSGIVATRGAT